jgi:signal transduction histidine kinase/ActR/RegA family two-component response regulator
MAGIDPSQTAGECRSHAVLALAHRWLAGEELTLIALTRDLAAAFGVSAAGVASLTDGVALVREPSTLDSPVPWVERPELLARIREAPGGVTARSSQGISFLCAAVRALDTSEWLFWVEHPGTHEWPAAEGAALALAGQVAGRWLNRKNTEEAGEPVWVRQLEHAMLQRRLEEDAVLTRRLAHDYGNVLTSILGFAELSLSQLPGESSLKRYLSEIHRGAQQGALLTSRLRLFARRPSASAQSTPLAPVVAGQRSRLAARGPEVALHFDVPGDLPPVALTLDALQDVLAPLLDNAWEATEQSPQKHPRRVTLTARTVSLSAEDCLDLWGGVSPGSHVQVDITDTGSGLTAEAEARLFREPFFTNKVRHRGLGLSIVYGVLRSHRGGLRLTRGPTDGVTACVFLPTPVGSPAPVVPDRAGTAAPKEQILVVDDDPTVLALVRDTLQRVGYRVQTASSAAEAMEKHAAARSQPFGLVLSDVIMRPTSGVELARQLLARDAGLRLLFMSGQASQESVRQELGGDGFELLTKPFALDGLLQAVRRALGTPPGRMQPAGPESSTGRGATEGLRGASDTLRGVRFS